jgi:hypothetical protein
MTKETEAFRDTLDALANAHLDALEANAAPLELAAAMLRIFHHIDRNASDRMFALLYHATDEFQWELVETAFDFLGEEKFKRLPRTEYLLALQRNLQEGILHKFAPGVHFYVTVDFVQKSPRLSRFHHIAVTVDKLQTFQDETEVMTETARNFGISKEHIESLEWALMTLFNYPEHWEMHRQGDFPDDFEYLMKLPVEKQIQAIHRHDAYILENHNHPRFTEALPLAALLEVAGALRLPRETALPHLPPMESLTRLRQYLCSPACGNAYQTLRMRLEQAANSHPENYRIAINRMIHEVFRKHFLIALDHQFQVAVLMPNEQGLYKVQVNASGFEKWKSQYKLTDDHLEALTWMLESIFNYAEELELPSNIWREDFQL